MPDRGLGAALEGALRGAVGVQTRKRERSEELEDQQRAQQQFIARLRLEQQLRQALQEAGFAQQTSEREAGQTFEAGQAAEGREFTSGENELGRLLQRELAGQSEAGAGSRQAESLAAALQRLDISEAGATERAEISASRTRQIPFTDPDSGEIFLLDTATGERTDTGQRGARTGTEREDRLSSGEEDVVSAAAARELLSQLSEAQQAEVQQAVKFFKADPLIFMLSNGFITQEQALEARARAKQQALGGATAGEDPRLEMIRRLEALEERLSGGASQ